MPTAEDDKKPGSGEGPPPSETMLAEQQRDPDEAVFAEQAIHHYAAQALDRWRDGLENAMAAFTVWSSAQADAQALDNQGLFEQVGTEFVTQLMQSLGGADSPIAQALRPMLQGAVDQSARQEAELGRFANELSRAGRDASWYLRDNLQNVLSNQWDQLRDLAYEGSTEFIPVLHQFGLPSLDWSSLDLSHGLIKTAETFRDRIPAKKEEAQQTAEATPEKEEEQVDAEQQQVMEEEQRTAE